MKSVECRAEEDKQEGNRLYRSGEFKNAIVWYTKALAYQSKNEVVLSNRAMCYLKTNEYAKAEQDCTLAIRSNENHVKSYFRLALALNALGRHVEGLDALQRGLALEPQNRQFMLEMRKTKELVKAAVRRATKTRIVVEESSHVKVKDDSIQVVDDSSHVKVKLEEPSVCEKEELKDAKVALLNVKEMQVPKSGPKTSYEFYKVWNALGTNKDTSTLNRGKYLKVLSILNA